MSRMVYTIVSPTLLSHCHDHGPASPGMSDARAEGIRATGISLVGSACPRRKERQAGNGQRTRALALADSHGGRSP